MIRHILLSFCTALLAFNANAQLDRSKVPSPGPEPEFSIGEFTEFSLDNGMKVILVENHKVARVTYQLRLDIPPINEKDKAGAASFAGSLLTAGTTNRTKEKLDEEVDFLGARLSAGPSYVYCSGLSRHKSKLFEIFTDVTLNPVFPEMELNKLKSQTLSSLQANKEDPSSISNNVTSAVVYGKSHPYGEIQTEETVAAINIEDCKNYYNQFFTPKVAYLVIVGDITATEAKKMVNQYFASWQGHSVMKGQIAFPKTPIANEVAFAHKTGAVQSVISISYPIENKPGAADAVASTIMNEILGGSSFGARLMQNLREDKAYTYGCRSSLSTDPYVATFQVGASVRNEVTDSAITQILLEMQGLIDDFATEDELTRVKASLKGSFSRRLENPQTIASFGLNMALYNLPKDYYNTYLKRVEAVTLADVKAAAAKYLKPANAHIVVVGDGVNVAPKLEKFGKLTYYDAVGNITTAPGFALEEGTTATQIIEKAIAAYGGNTKLSSIKSYEIKLEATTPMGVLLIKKVVVGKKNQLYQGVYAGGALINKTIVNNDEFYAGGPGGEQDLDDATKAKLLREIPIHEELILVKEPNNLKLVGGEFFAGEKVAVIECNQNGEITKRFYNLETGFLVAVSSIQDGKEVLWTFNEYKSFGGVYMPSKSFNSAMNLTFESTSVLINEKVDKKMFKI